VRVGDEWNWFVSVEQEASMKSLFCNLFWHDQRSEIKHHLTQQSFLLEPLENRLLLSADPLGVTATVTGVDQVIPGPSTIVWANRGQASDNFDAAFGAGAPADAARAVVDAAIDAWNRVVVNFNHAAGIGPPDLSETISMNLGNPAFGAGTTTTIGADGKPTAGSVTINLGDPDGDGTSNWWVDPTPNDNSEFMGNIVNAFAGDAQAGSPAFGQNDLFTVVLAELTHNMGIANAGAATARYNTGGFYTDTGIADDAEGPPGNFFLFQGPSIDALMTQALVGGSAFPLHTAGPRAGNSSITFGGSTVFGAEDNGNALFETGRRYLVSNRTALVLQDAYDYNIVMPETFGTFYAVLDETTGLLTIRGGADNTLINNVNQGPSSDNITITRDGDNIVVSVDVGVDVPGTGTGRALNDQQDAFVSVFGAGQVRSISVLAGGGNDRIVIGRDVNVPITVSDGAGDDFVDFSQSSVGVTYTPDGGNDTVLGTPFNDTFFSGVGNDTFLGGGGSDTFNWSPGDGNDVIEGGDGNDVLVFNGSGLAETFTLSAVGTRLQLQRNVSSITMDVAGVEQVDLNALGGGDFTTVNDLTPTDVQVINIDLGVGAADNVTVKGRAVADNLTAALSSIGVVTVSGLDYNVNVSNASAADDTLTVDGDDGNDTIKAVPQVESTIGIVLSGGDGNDYLSGDATLSGGAGNDILIGGAGGDSIFGDDGDDLLDGRGGSNTLDGGAGTDTILVSGTAGADNITIDHIGGSFTITGGLSTGTNAITGMEAVRVEGGDGPDYITLNISVAGGLNYTVLGGNPIGAPGDILQVNSSATMAVTPGPENDAGSVDVATPTPTNVSYDEIEQLIIGGPGAAVINGTEGPDTITVRARDSSTHAGADGVQDFTVALNTLPEILFLNKASLFINALGGSDQITLQTPAPNNAVWDVDVTIDGGLPPADTDRVIVETPVVGGETAVCTPDAFDGGKLDLTTLSSPITMTHVEALVYDGRGDSDILTIVGTDDADTIVHNPGSSNQAGTLQVNNLLALSYQNLGSAVILTVDGGGDTDTLVYNGTAINDSFIITGAGSPGGAGQVSLNSRLPLNTIGVETLTLEGLSGDDTFTLMPAISASVYSTINFNGGDQASAAGDRVILFGTPSDDNIIVNGSAILLGGRTINTSGIESVSLDALANGGDYITYNGLSVPGIILINFRNVENIIVNGNAPTPTETDTLTFVGTNNVDTFQINLAAAGIPGDPVLQLKNGTTTLLTLENYSNFNTLRVLGLDGEDTFNVKVAATGPSRNLFVDGGAPTGKKKSTDNLNINYVSPRPSIIHSAATQDPDAGLVDLDYGTARFVVQYDDIEQVVIRKN
jgi:hypothetical protein